LRDKIFRVTNTRTNSVSKPQSFIGFIWIYRKNVLGGALVIIVYSSTSNMAKYSPENTISLWMVFMSSPIQ